jgi:hypothetical protein
MLAQHLSDFCNTIWPRYCIASHCNIEVVPNFKHFSQMFSMRLRCMLGVSIGGLHLQNCCIRDAPVGVHCDIPLPALITVLKIY